MGSNLSIEFNANKKCPRCIEPFHLWKSSSGFEIDYLNYKTIDSGLYRAIHFKVYGN